MSGVEHRISRAAVRDAVGLCAAHFRRPDLIRFRSAAMSWRPIGLAFDCHNRRWSNGMQPLQAAPAAATPIDRGGVRRVVDRARHPHPFDLRGRDGLREVYRTFGCGPKALKADLQRSFL